jgi:hypothetical protein
MAHWAEIDKNNVVIRVLVTDNNDPNGDEGHQFLVDTFGGRWIQTSYNSNFRRLYAGTGYIYNEENDVFIPPCPFASWTLNEDSYWIAPTPKPEEGFWVWNEEDGLWEELPEPPLPFS